MPGAESADSSRAGPAAETGNEDRRPNSRPSAFGCRRFGETDAPPCRIAVRWTVRHRGAAEKRRPSSAPRKPGFRRGIRRATSAAGVPNGTVKNSIGSHPKSLRKDRPRARTSRFHRQKLRPKNTRRVPNCVFEKRMNFCNFVRLPTIIASDRILSTYLRAKNFTGPVSHLRGGWQPSYFQRIFIQNNFQSIFGISKPSRRRALPARRRRFPGFFPDVRDVSARIPMKTAGASKPEPSPPRGRWGF